MEQLPAIRSLLRQYGIVNEPLALEILILITQAEKEQIKRLATV